jgi:hypothetical protein
MQRQHRQSFNTDTLKQVSEPPGQGGVFGKMARKYSLINYKPNMFLHNRHFMDESEIKA